ncbi:3-dehydroquinate synthase [candidate division KSB1 bacterium]|nr:3-dehydroquinate synthase [candidate division KSB1 bacterium]
MRILNVNLGNRAYPIFIEADGFEKAAKKILRQCDSKTYIIISDENVASHYYEKLTSFLEQGEAKCYLYKITPGEESKSLTTAEQIYTWMLANRFHRDDVIIALGGGVVGDLAGFVAATYLRGIRWVQIPTTLMAQVDSSVGGKVGVNHPLAKNCIGAFYQPQLVWIDPLTLTTLPRREIYNGLAEVIKYGLILDPEFFEFLEINFDNIVSLQDSELLNQIIKTCCRLKSIVVEKDERETDYRRILNFGHTIGHALENITDYHYFRHGEAVAWGMLAAAAISQKSLSLPGDHFFRIESMIHLLEKPALPIDIAADQIVQAIQSDKKMTSVGLKFVLLESIGNCRVELVNRELIEFGVNYLLTINKKGRT